MRRASLGVPRGIYESAGSELTGITVPGQSATTLVYSALEGRLNPNPPAGFPWRQESLIFAWLWMRA